MSAVFFGSSTRARMAWVACALIALAAVPARAQDTGRIVGRVIDAATGAGLAEVGIQVVGTTIGTSSGVDGRYVLSTIPAGTVTLHLRRIGYQAKTVTGIVLPAGGAIEQDVTLAAATIKLQATVVTALAERGSVSKALDEQRGSSAIVNSTTAEQIGHSPDANAAQAVQRVSGVTVQDGKYVFVRGLGERYTTTSLNGARVPSPEPEKKLVPLDLFPANLIEAISTSKTFTPDQPGDFSGAAVNIRTREFPAHRTSTLSVSAGLNTAATGRRVLGAPTVGSEWLGFAGGARSLPSAVRAAGDLTTVAEGAPTNALLRTFRNAWTPSNATGQANGSTTFTLGGEDPVLGHRVGYLLSTTYSTNQEVRHDEHRAVPVGDGQGGARALSTFDGETGRTSVLWGGLFNAGTWLGARSRLSVDNTYTRSAENSAMRLAGVDEQYGELRKSRLSFVERSVVSSQLRGDHVLGERQRLDWSASYSSVTRDEPDRADLVYDRELGQLAWKGGANDATRTFSDLTERASSGALNYQVTLAPASHPMVVKVGAAQRDVHRDANTLAYDVINQKLDVPDRTQAAERIFGGQYAAGPDTNLLIARSSFGGRYNATERVTAGYVMLDAELAPRVRAITGARIEHAGIDVTTVTAQNVRTPAALDDTDLLPSVALTLRLTELQNLRLSATQTLSRPEYRELSEVAYTEVGGDDEEVGNRALRRSLIRNYDLRWEWYPSAAEVFSVGLFAKEFDHPIERVYRGTTGASVISFTNAAGAANFGLEVDARKSLAPLGSVAAPFTTFANLTVMRSRIRIDDPLSVAFNPRRPMVGQAPFVVNAGLDYAPGDGQWNATLLYNVVGRRITIAGVDPVPDTYESPRHILDVSAQFPVPLGLRGKLNARNLLDAPFVEKTGELDRRRYRTGRVLSLGFTWAP
jgi:TonB-dependent receptor